MSIFEKLGFKKKSDEERSADLPPMGPTGDMPPMREPSMPNFESAEPPTETPRPSFESPRQDSRSADLVNAKLDAIKAILDNINSRIERLEKIAAGEEETPRWR